jgi:iron complex transport system substrate-binding protein
MMIATEERRPLAGWCAGRRPAHGAGEPPAHQPPSRRRSGCAATRIVFLLLLFAAHLHAAPRRIVTLAPSCAEIASGIGLEDAIVGVTDYTDWPARLKSLPNVGSYVKINVEAVLALHPDLVLATDDGNPPATLQRLQDLGLRVVTMHLRDLDAIEGSILDLGATTGHNAAARRIVAEMRRVTSCVAARTRNVHHPRVLFAFDLDPLVAPGRGTFTNQLLALAGADSITRDVAQPYPHLGMESVVARAPELILVSSMNPAGDAARVRDTVAKWPPIPAVRSGRVQLIDASNLDRPSQRIVYGITLLARTIHPALFAHGECAAALP